MDGVVPYMLGMILGEETLHSTLFHLGICHMAFGDPTFHHRFFMSHSFELDVTILEHDITL
jgi:hypothetical protein